MKYFFLTEGVISVVLKRIMTPSLKDDSPVGISDMKNDGYNNDEKDGIMIGMIGVGRIMNSIIMALIIVIQKKGLLAFIKCLLNPQSRWFPGSWQRRLHGLVAVCLYVPSLAALTIFLSNLENAFAITTRIFISGKSMLFILF